MSWSIHKDTTFFILWLPLLVASHAQASLIEVNSLLDTTANDGFCTLREAINSANTNSPSGAMPGECAAGSGTDTIEFPAPLVGTIGLGSPLPTISAPLEINGPSDRSIVVHAGAITSLISTASSSSGFPVSLRRLTFSGANASLIANGQLHVDSSLIRNSRYNGIDASNSDGRLWVTNSTISGVQFGPAIDAPTGNGFGTISLVNTTVTLSLEGLQGNVSLINSVVAQNTVDCGTSSTRITAFIGSFIGDATCTQVHTSLPANGSAMLLPLANNGGPTMTHGLAIGSPLRDSGDAGACLNLDQRGNDRANDGDGLGGTECDIGAVEVADDMSTAVYLKSFQVE